MQTDPLMAGLHKTFSEFVLIPDESQSVDAFEMLDNPLKHHLQLNQTPARMFESLVNKLNKENSQLGNHLSSNLRSMMICMNCGHRETGDYQAPVLKLTNEKEEFSKSLSVTLKILYIFEGDQCKKYEIRLRPGEYLHNDIISRIKDKVQ